MSSLKKKTKTTQTSTSTTTPNVPDWLTGPYQDAAKGVTGIMSRPVTDFAPTSTPELDSTFTDAANLKTPDYSAATKLLDGVNYDIGGQSAADFMGKYRDLFSKDVIDPVLADFDVNAGKVRAAQAADGARNQAFRGGRFGLREGQTEGELARGRAATHGGLLRDAAQFALSGATGDAGRAQQAQEGNRAARFTGTGLLSDITGRQGADTRATLDMRNRIATQNADLQNTIKQFPIELQGKIEGLLAGLNPSLFTGSTTNANGTSTSVSSGLSIENILKAAAQAAATAAVASDRRLKTDIRRVGRLDTGEGVYVYRMKEGGPFVMGVMAQEVREARPAAVVTRPDGMMAVKYGDL